MNKNRSLKRSYKRRKRGKSIIGEKKRGRKNTCDKLKTTTTKKNSGMVPWFFSGNSSLVILKYLVNVLTTA